MRFRKPILVVGVLAALTLALQSARSKDTPAAKIGATTGLANATIPSAQSDAGLVLKDLLVGDLALRGELDLTKMELTKEHYQVPLSTGAHAVLTLEPAAQKVAEKVLAQAKAPMAAVVVMRTDGRIVALAGRTQEEGKVESKPSLALSVWAPAASVFKIITASALLEAGVKGEDKVCYHGGLRSVDKSNLVDNPRADSACNDLGYGLAKSQNALMAKLASRHLDEESLSLMARKFGFGKTPQFALDAEPGRIQVPSDPLEFARVSAGFWSTEISPLGAAFATNVVASDGQAVTPRIVAEVVERERTIPVVEAAAKQVLDKEVAQEIATMMTGTVRYGTAFKAFHDKRGRPYLGEVKVAGKTGSLSRTTPSFLAYSWFVGFAPAEDPQYVVAVLLGNSALWHLKAHTAARLVLDKLL